MNFRVGDIVISKAGRDKGKYFVVVSVENENFVYVADGKLRKADNPKLKKCKHLLNTESKSELIKTKLSGADRVTNPDLKKELAKYNL